MAWRLAEALKTLRDQIDEAAPGRGKSFDGSIGDVRHQKGVSEHNPDRRGVVRAIDVTHDPAHGVDGRRLAEDIIDELDRRRARGYVIWNRRIRSTYVDPGRWRPYRGSNPHDHHVHVSILSGVDSRARWSLPSLDEAVVTVVNPGRVAVDGDLGPATMQRVAYILGLDKYTNRSWWRAVQAWAGLSGAAVDGVPGPQTWEAVRVRLGSGAGKVDGIVTAWQEWCNSQDKPADTPPRPAVAQAAAEGPKWMLPATHLIGPNPRRRVTWHDGKNDDTTGRAAIRTWQEQMRARGWTLDVDGYWGAQCTRVLRAFQTEKGLPVDGILGPDSWAAAWAAPVAP